MDTHLSLSQTGGMGIGTRSRSSTAQSLAEGLGGDLTKAGHRIIESTPVPPVPKIPSSLPAPQHVSSPPSLHPEDLTLSKRSLTPTPTKPLGQVKSSPMTTSTAKSITSVLLPRFPTTLHSLESIQILAASIYRKVETPADGVTSAKGLSGSSRPSTAGNMPSTQSFPASAASMSLTSSNAQLSVQTTPRRSKSSWSNQTMILTAFKIGKSETSRLIAHLHIFSSDTTASPNTNSSSRRPKSSAGIGGGGGSSSGGVPAIADTEVERRILDGGAIAKRSDEIDLGNGGVGFRMRFGEGEDLLVELSDG